MEQKLLDLAIDAADDEEMNAIFRCAHSVKGGAATFGFSDVAELTHHMETLLDKLRRHELQPTSQMVDVLLAAGDALKALLARHQGNGGDAVDTRDLVAHIRALAEGGNAPSPAPAPAAPSASASAAAPAPAPLAMPKNGVIARALCLTVGPLEDLTAAEGLFDLFKEVTNLGTIEPLANGSAEGMRRFKIVTTSTDGDLLDLFTFHIAREHMQLAPLDARYGCFPDNPGAPT